MMPQSQDCPRAEALSAMIDGELSAREHERITAHAAVCPLCGTMLRQFVALRGALLGSPDPDAGVDVAALVEPRLAPREPAGRAHARRHWPWQHAPMGAAGVGVLATGVYLGMLLMGGTAAVATRPAAMAVFDAIPPGGLCVGASCASGTR
ncbi:MAG TPA: zf-HC2 domain-containing protein [Burkholderiales bacterium]|nr:zf-HC2 domain-containing protein [Burkholderiales bacterium]